MESYILSYDDSRITFLFFFNFNLEMNYCFCVGWGTDEKAIIAILGRRNAVQRKLIRKTYEDLYQEDIIKRLESELSGDFEVINYLINYIPNTNLCNFKF